MNNLEDIKARFNRVKVDIRNIKDKSEEVYYCPVCNDCPFCHGDQHVKGMSWVYNNLAAGIQVFGIGEDLEALEDFCKNAHDDIKSLLSVVDDLNKEVERLIVKIRKRNDTLEQLCTDSDHDSCINCGSVFRKDKPEPKCGCVRVGANGRVYEP